MAAASPSTIIITSWRGSLHAAARHVAALVAVQVLGGVPAVGGQVPAPAEGQPVVDHQHLLVMAGAHRHRRVEQEAHRRVLEAGPRPVREEVLGRGHRQGRLPDQDAHVQRPVGARQVTQERPGLVAGRPRAVRVGDELGQRVEGPAQQVDRPRRLEHGGLGGAEIVLAVDDDRRAARARGSPARPSRFQQHNPPPNARRPSQPKAPATAKVPPSGSAKRTAPYGVWPWGVSRTVNP